MSENQNRASLRLVYEKDIDNRYAVLDEAFREIVEGRSEYWAERNKHIVLEDEHLNEAYVNEGNGELVPCDDINEIVEYGASRVAQLSRKPRKEKKIIDENGDIKTDGKGTVTTLSFVAHLPKYLCDEIPDFYADIDEESGEEVTYSRWVAKDKNVARDYFEDVVDYVAENVLPGGIDSILGVDIQFSETTPHVQIIADPFAPHPTKPGKLRAEFSRAFGYHEEVVDEHGKGMQSTGHDGKLSRYQAGLRKCLISKGWEIDLDPDPKRKGQKGAPKSEYEKAQTMRRKAERDIEKAAQATAKAAEDTAIAEAIEAQGIDMALTNVQRLQDLQVREAELLVEEHFAELEVAEKLREIQERDKQSKERDERSKERDKRSKERESLLDEMESEVAWYKSIHHRIKMTDEQRARSNARIARNEKLLKEYKSADEVPNAYTGAETEQQGGMEFG